MGGSGQELFFISHESNLILYLSALGEDFRTRVPRVIALLGYSGVRCCASASIATRSIPTEALPRGRGAPHERTSDQHRCKLDGAHAAVTKRQFNEAV